jgi:hypothetical protein
VQPLGFLGNTPRNYLRGPGLKNLDFSVVKDTAVRLLGENGKVQFRTEIFNLFNHANFNQPGTAVFGGTTLTSSGGVILTTRTFSRQIQFGLKILF